MIKTRADGPVPTRIMLVGEAPGAEEEVRGIPFVGYSGQEMDRMLHEAGLLRSDCFVTNVCKYRPPENKIESFFLDSKRSKPNELIKEGLRELWNDIGRVQPQLIIALGNLPFWALHGQKKVPAQGPASGITKWRGSMLDIEYPTGGYSLKSMLMPTYHPAAITRQWDWRAIAVNDLRRCREALERGSWPRRERIFHVRPSFQDAMSFLGELLSEADREAKAGSILTIASDIETRAGYIACHGIARSAEEAMCIPYMCVERPLGYWTLDEQVAIWHRQRTLLTHPAVEVVGQNYLYDAQYFARREGYVPRLRHDLMFMQQTAFPGLPKGLDFLSSMYRTHHIYWKDEGKNWNKNQPEEQLWTYNCEDAIATFETRFVLESVLKQMGLWEHYLFQMKIWPKTLKMMLRGIRIDQLLRGRIAGELIEAVNDRQQWLEAVLGHEINIDSPKQIHHLFYNQIRCQVIRDRKTKQPTCDEDALKKFTQREPLLKCITEPIVEIRSLGAMISNVIQAGLDADGRLRASVNPAATETFRWNSSKNPWGGGTNMQNWTKGTEDE